MCVVPADVLERAAMSRVRWTCVALAVVAFVPVCLSCSRRAEQGDETTICLAFHYLETEFWVAAQADLYLQPLLAAGIIFLAVLLDSLRTQRLARLSRRTIRIEEI
jgi:hypothetical protein